MHIYTQYKKSEILRIFRLAFTLKLLLSILFFALFRFVKTHQNGKFKNSNRRKMYPWSLHRQLQESCRKVKTSNTITTHHNDECAGNYRRSSLCVPLQSSLCRVVIENVFPFSTQPLESGALGTQRSIVYLSTNTTLSIITTHSASATHSATHSASAIHSAEGGGFVSKRGFNSQTTIYYF